MKKHSPLVSILILTYNRTDLLKNCLNSALGLDYPNLEFIISDNGSSEDIGGFIKKNYPKEKIKVVRLKENRGLTGGFNFGFKFCQGKYIMILSNDTKIQRKAISYMVRMSEEDSSIGIVSPKIIQMKKPKYLHHAGSFLTYSGLLYHYGILQNKNNKKYQKSYYVFSCNGAGFLIRRKVVLRTGLFDDDFFVYYDESDLSHRVWLAGFTVVYHPKAELLHMWGATMQGANPEIWFYNHRNHVSSFIKNLSPPFLIILLFNLNLAMIFWFFLNVLKLRFDNAIALPKTYIWHLLHFKETLKRRKFVQNSIRKVSDREIFIRCLISPNWKYYFIHLYVKYKDKELPQRVIYKKYEASV